MNDNEELDLWSVIRLFFENPLLIKFSPISLVSTEVSQKTIELNLPYGIVLKIPVK